VSALRHVIARLGPAGSGTREQGDVAAAPTRGEPVLLLHGFFSTPRSLGALEARLRRAGCIIIPVDLGGFAGRNTRAIDRLAERVAAQVERWREAHPGSPRITVIAHSMGGLVAAHWVKHLGGHLRVRTLVTLGTPFRGSRLAWTGLPIAALAPAVLQMIPGSPFLRRLASTSWPGHVRVVSLYSRHDAWVPYPSAQLDPSAGPHLVNLEVDGTHRDFLLSKRIFGILLSEFRRPALAAVRAGEIIAA